MPAADWLPWFRDPKREEVVRLEEEQERARKWLEMTDSPGFLQHLEYLDREIAKPLKVGGENDMIVAAVRGNSFKEIREEIRKATERAKRLLSAGEREDA